MVEGLILHDGDYRHEQLIIRSPDHTQLQVIAKGTRRQLLKYAEQNNIQIIF